MADILAFNPRNTVVIDFGKVTASSDRSTIGKLMFFVAWCDESGAELGLHHTEDYGEATLLAEEARRDFEAREVIDRTVPQTQSGGSAS